MVNQVARHIHHVLSTIVITVCELAFFYYSPPNSFQDFSILDNFFDCIVMVLSFHPSANISVFVDFTARGLIWILLPVFRRTIFPLFSPLLKSWISLIVTLINLNNMLLYLIYLTYSLSTWWTSQYIPFGKSDHSVVYIISVQSFINQEHPVHKTSIRNLYADRDSFLDSLMFNFHMAKCNTDESTWFKAVMYAFIRSLKY